MPDKSSGIFRKQALEVYVDRKSETGDPLQIASGWTRWTYWLLVAVFLAALVYGTLGRVSEYAEGPAAVRVLEGAGPGAAAACAVRAVLPVRFGSRIRGATSARFSPDGFPGSHESVAIEAVDLEIVGTAEGQRYLGFDRALPDPGVRLEGSVDDCRFDYDGEAISYRDGMRGTLEVQVGSERILVTLIPGLKKRSTR